MLQPQLLLALFFFVAFLAFLAPSLSCSERGIALKADPISLPFDYYDLTANPSSDNCNSCCQFFGKCVFAAFTLTTAAVPLETFAATTKISGSFTNVKKGDTVPLTFTYKFEVTRYELPLAKDGLKEGTGHHHLVIDGPKQGYVDKGVAVPFNDTHKHYSKAQSEHELILSKGKHTLTL